MADNTVLPTTDDLAKKASLPTTDELAGQADNHGVFSGALSDAYFALGAPNRILHSFSQSAAQAWGASQDQVSPETSAYRSGGPQLPKEYHEGRSAVLKAANESWMRSAAHGVWERMNSAARVVNYGLTHPLNTALGAIDAGVQGIPGAIEGVAEQFGHTGQYLREGDKTQIGLGRVAGYPFSAVGELVSGVGQGAFIPEAPHAVFLDHGRAVGAIGESEGKYFGTSDLTARDHAARAEAVAQTIKNAPDIHEAARKYAPDAFAHYDSLQDVREHFKSELDRQTTERGFDPEYKDAKNRVDEILSSVNHDESELTEEKANELSGLRDKLEVDSPGMADARKTLKDVEGRITDLSPHIHEAYQLADAGNRVLNPDAVPDKEAPKATPKSAEELSQGEIAKDVEAKLLKAGRPADEAKIAGILYQQRYENRVSKSPHLGTAEELYKNEGPDILRGTEGKDGRDALNQYVGTKAFRGTKEGLARSKKLSTAVKMESAGKTPEQISLATGWVRSPFDKKWKYEISDKDASLTQAFHELLESKIFGETHEMKLGDALKHDRLFEAYPEAKDIRVTKRGGLFDFGSLQGSFDEKGNVLNLTPYAKDHLSTALHEVQHWIQSKEGFARGGNENTVFEHLSPEKKAKLFEEAIIKTKRAFSEVAQKLEVFKKAVSHLDEVDVTAYRQLKKYSDDLWKDRQRLEKKDKEDGLPIGENSPQFKAASHDWHVAYTEVGKLAKDIHKTLFDGKDYLDLPEGLKSTSIDIDRVLEGVKTPEEIIEKYQKDALDFQELLSKLHQGDEKVLKKAVGDAGYKFYRAIAGEIEARDTQARKDLTEEERAATAPYDSQSDIDHDDVITHFGELANKVDNLSVSKAHPSDWLNLIDRLKETVPDDNWSQLKSWIGKEYRNGNKEITKEDLINHIQDNQELFQQKKGSLTRGTPRNIIKLFRAADASTFFHETGHQWLEELVTDGSHPDASPELRADLQTARDFLGNKEEPLTRAQHEKFARSFERYLREGHAPTKELSVVFQKFKDWLTDIYKTLRDLPNSKIDDSIRDVFDRLIVPERTRDVVTNDDLEQRGTARQRERDLQNHIQEIKEQARTRQIYKFMSEVRERAAASKGQLTDKRYIGPESDQIKEGMPLPEATPAETESTAETETSTGEKSEGDPNAELKIKSGPLVDNAGNIRVENLTSDQDLADSIKLAYEVNKDELDKSRGKISSQATIDLAEAGGIASKDINMKALIRAAQNGGIPLSSYIHLLRNAFLESAKHLKGVMEGNDEIAYAEASTRHMALSRHLMGITAEWGRAGHSFRSLAEEAREAQDLNEFMQMSLGKTLKQLKSEMAFGRYLDSPKKVSGFVQDMSKTGYGEWILEMFKNWLISGPITHMTYAVGNEIFALNRLLESAARVGISSLRGDDIQGSHAGEVRERMYGLLSGHVDGIRAAWDSFDAGQTALLPGEEHATTAFTQHKAIPDFKVGPVNFNLGSAVRLPSERMVAPLHSFARSVAFAEERNGLIFRKAYGEGLRGDALERRIAELKNNVPVDITVAARAAASESALMRKAGDFTRKAVAWINSPLELPQWAGGTWRPGGFIAPFITVSSNINRLALLERSPIGLASKTVRDDLLGKNGRFKQDVAISKMAVGTGIGIAAGTLYAMDAANPAAPEDFKHATVLQAVQGLPHSIRVGEMSYDLSRLGVLGTTFSTALDIAALGAGVIDSVEKGDHHIAEEAAVTWFHSMTEHLETEGFMSGISDLMKAVNDSDRYGESWAKNFVSSLVVPYSVGMSQTAQRIDPYQRDTKGIDALDSISRAIRAKIPFESETLEEKVDLFGQPVPSKEYWGVYATRMSQDPAWIALKDLGYFPAPVKRTINGVKLTPHQYHDYATKAGITAKLLLDNVVNMEGFSELDGATKHELVKDAITSGRQSAAEIIKAESVGSDNDIMKHATELKDQIGKTE